MINTIIEYTRVANICQVKMQEREYVENYQVHHELHDLAPMLTVVHLLFAIC